MVPTESQLLSNLPEMIIKEMKGELDGGRGSPGPAGSVNADPLSSGNLEGRNN